MNGYVVGMTADLVDRKNRPITIRDVMLHHLVFHRRAYVGLRGDCSSRFSEPIYGTGEERQKLRFPPGSAAPPRGDRNHPRCHAQHRPAGDRRRERRLRPSGDLGSQ